MKIKLRRMTLNLIISTVRWNRWQVTWLDILYECTCQYYMVYFSSKTVFYLWFMSPVHNLLITHAHKLLNWPPLSTAVSSRWSPRSSWWDKHRQPISVNNLNTLLDSCHDLNGSKRANSFVSSAIVAFRKPFTEMILIYVNVYFLDRKKGFRLEKHVHKFLTHSSH